jgi:hypothetical protein
LYLTSLAVDWLQKFAAPVTLLKEPNLNTKIIMLALLPVTCTLQDTIKTFWLENTPLLQTQQKTNLSMFGAIAWTGQTIWERGGRAPIIVSL